MLYYCDVGLSHAEVPGETSLCFYISGCINRCKNCHFPELQFAEYGERLPLEIFIKLVELYSPYETCICFMGEGVGFDVDKPLSSERVHIGLSIVKDRLKRMCGGNVEITSEENKGTICEITIPIEFNTYN